MYLCAQRSCNAFCSIQALPWDCTWLMGEAALQRGLLYWTSSFGTIKVSAIRTKLLCARSRAFPVCGIGRNTPRDRAPSGILSQHEASFSDAAEHTAALIAKGQATKRGFLLHLPLPPGQGQPCQGAHLTALWGGSGLQIWVTHCLLQGCPWKCEVAGYLLL